MSCFVVEKSHFVGLLVSFYLSSDTALSPVGNFLEESVIRLRHKNQDLAVEDEELMPQRQLIKVLRERDSVQAK